MNSLIKKIDQNLFEDLIPYIDAIKNYDYGIKKETIERLQQEIINKAKEDKDFNSLLNQNKMLNILNKLNYAASILGYYSRKFSLNRNTKIELLGSGTISTARHNYIPNIPNNNEVIKNINSINNINMKFYGKQLIPPSNNIASTTSECGKLSTPIKLCNITICIIMQKP